MSENSFSSFKTSPYCHCEQSEAIPLSHIKFQRGLCHSGQGKESKLECSLADFANEVTFRLNRCFSTNMTNLIFNGIGL